MKREEGPGRRRPADADGTDDRHGLLEREAELLVIDGLLEQAGDGEPAVALVEGPGGVGKTALLRAARDRAATAGFRALHAQADELTRHIPFGVVQDLFGPLIHHDARERWFVGGAAGAARVLAGDAADGGEDPYAVHQAFWSLCRNLCAETPLLLTVDDAQLADAASLGALESLVRRMTGRPLLLLLSARAGDAGPGATVLARLAAECETVEVRPRPLSATGAARLVRDHLGDGASDELCAACHAVCAGNPFLLHRLVAELRQEGIAPGRIDPEHVRRLGPRSISRAVLVRLARLDPLATAVGRAVAVLGDGTSPAHVAALAKAPADRIAAVADQLAEAGVLQRSLALRYVHPIVRSAVLADLAPHERASMHARAAAVLEEAGAPAVEVAGHLLRTTPAGSGETVRTLRAAARHAATRGAPDEAAEFLRRALREPPEPAEREEILLELARAERDRRPEEALEHLAELAGLPSDPRRLADVERVRAGALLALDRVADAVSALESAVAHADAAGDASMATDFEAELVFTARLDVATTAAGAAHRENLAARPGIGPRARAVVRADAALQLALEGKDRRGAVAAARAATAGDALAALDDPGPVCAAAIALAWADELDAAADVLERARRAAVTRGGARTLAAVTAFAGCVHHAMGRLQEAETALREAFTILPGASWGRGGVPAAAALVEVVLDRVGHAVAERVLAEQQSFAVGEPAWQSVLLPAVRARVRLASGDAAGALADAEVCVTRLRARGIHNPCAVGVGITRVLALEQLDRRDEARRVAAAELEAAERWGAPSPAALRRWLFARLQDAGDPGVVADLRAALDTLGAGARVLDHARVLVDHGAALRRRNARAEARAHLLRGHALAERCGATPLVELAAQELASLGVRRPRGLEAGRDELTPAERRVVALAAEGLPNRVIAERLFLSLKTVETHLTSSYRKLGVRTRYELMRRAS